MKKVIYTLSIIGCVVLLAGCERNRNNDEIINTETAPIELLPENVSEVSSEQNSSQKELVPTGDSKTIEGYQMSDGYNLAIEAAFTVREIHRGDQAYRLLAENNSALPQADTDMEYIVVIMDVSYRKGEAETLYIMENYASLDAAKMYFALTDGDGSAEDMTACLNNSIYDLSVSQGESGQGAVAFLHRKGNKETLSFVGFDNIIQFDLAD